MELNPKTYEPNIALTAFVRRYWTLDDQKEDTPLKYDGVKNYQMEKTLN